MYEIDAAAHHEAIRLLGMLIERAEAKHRDSAIKPEPFDEFGDQYGLLTDLGNVLEPLDVRATKRAVRETSRLIKNFRPLSDLQVLMSFMEISNSLRRELESVKMFTLNTEQASFYEPEEPLFGEDVAIKFQSLIDEIDEAGKCYACGLYTACAFHLMRCLEVGIQAIAKCLDIPDPDKGPLRNWGTILKEIKAKTGPQKSMHELMGDDARFFDEIHTALAAIQTTYRNPTMHFDVTYKDKKAFDLFNVVKGLMQKIASRMDEDGQPRA